MKKILFLLSALVLIAGVWYWQQDAVVQEEERLEAAFETNKGKEESKEVSTASTDVYEVTVITNSDQSFGYDILKNGKRFIHQPMIPGVAGNTGFSTSEQAMAVGQLVVSKLEKSIMPPSVNMEELKQLNVL